MKNKIISLTLGLAIACSVFVAFSVLFERISVTYRSPIVVSLQSPIVITSRGVKAAQATDEAKIMEPVPLTTITITVTPTQKPHSYASPELNAIVVAVATLETNNGRATTGHGVKCNNIGKTNQYGYGVYQNFCFDDEEIAYKTIYNWFDKRLNQEKLTLAEAACYYNLGKKDGKHITSCTYSEDLEKLLN